MFHPIVVVHMLGGKDTLVADGAGYDVDSARNPEVEPVLARLREGRKWALHNSLWHDLIRIWSSSLPDDGKPVFVRHPSDGMAVMNHGDVYRIDVPIADFAARLVERASRDPEYANLAVINRGGLINNPQFMSLPIWKGGR